MDFNDIVFDIYDCGFDDIHDGYVYVSLRGLLSYAAVETV